MGRPRGHVAFVIFSCCLSNLACSAQRDIFFPSIFSDTGRADRERLQSGLTAQVVRRVAVNNTVIVTWANIHYVEFVSNFLSHLRVLNLTNVLVGAMDKPLYQHLAKQGVATWMIKSKAMQGKSASQDFHWGTHRFHMMGRDKVRIIRDLTILRVDALITDMDVVWLKDPLPYFWRFPEAEVLISTDQMHNSSAGDGLELQVCGAASNIGIMWVRSTEGTRALTREWLKELQRTLQTWDQQVFNLIKEKGGTCALRVEPSEASGGGMAVPVYEGRVRLGVLPLAMFLNGHAYYIQQLHRRLRSGLEAYAAHATMTSPGGTLAKIHRMRAADLWRADQPSYFQHTGGFITYDPHFSADLNWLLFSARGHPSQEHAHEILESNSAEIREHIRLVESQLHQLRDALALAWSLGRLLVVPPVLCGFDRMQFAHKGRFPGSLLELPFVCPLDHVLDLPLAHKLAKGRLRFREHSFACSPHVEPAPSPRTQVDVIMAPQLEEAPRQDVMASAVTCGLWNVTGSRVAMLQANSSVEQIVRQLEGHVQGWNDNPDGVIDIILPDVD
ncbi:hypothetical protein CYMTET_18457 [Cymbomonas tetramitiformis]|uniref:Nucleotide-diphospho-sugar transferase domain-containing protein n=1 Tax=Cymbomonas tetramitiformis TaxID=36881 RepID=A0AAE0G886_9CHLO|nr:hypothetical protein CYMTET_18457 [Cymbomonas tetramitiformis]